MPSPAILHYSPEPLDCGRQQAICVCFVRGEKKVIPRAVPEWRSGRSGGGSQKKHALRSHCKAMVVSKSWMLTQEWWLTETFVRVTPDRATSVLPQYYLSITTNTPIAFGHQGFLQIPGQQPSWASHVKLSFYEKRFPGIWRCQILPAPSWTKNNLWSSLFRKNYSYSGNAVSQLGWISLFLRY